MVCLLLFSGHERHFIRQIKIIERAHCLHHASNQNCFETIKESPMKKIIRINLKERSYEITQPSGPYRNLGGRGLTSSIVAREVPPDCDALGPDNKLVIAGGILAGTSVPNSGRLSIGAKSPLTNTIKEANAGGSAAQKLARLGILALVLEGRADGLTTLKIDANGVTFLSAGDLPMIGNLDCIKYYRNRHGDGISIISIGPAGEMGMKAAAVSVTSPDFLPRMAARGGLGAVMGSKNVKAIVIDDTGGSNVTIKDKELFKASAKAFTQGMTAHPLMDGLKHFGTPLLVGMINEMGAICTKNYSMGRFDGAATISGEHIAELMQKRPNAQPSHRCMNGCAISCSQVFTDAQGQIIVSGLEYETLALMGSNCMIDDVDVIARMNARCNDIGVDTMDVGGALAVAMEAGRLPWGDGPKALALVEEIAKGTNDGKMIGNGCRYTGELLGITRIPQVKGQCLAGYDPRVLKGTGVTYATSPMGADHTCGNALPSPANPDYNPSASSGQAPVSLFLQRYFAAIDTLGVCLFASLPALDIPDLQQHLIDCTGAVLDETLGADYLMQLGAMVLNEERKFNLAAGHQAGDDRLPSFFTREALAPGGNTFDVSEEELDSLHG
jgi:aldehyde:ferredoxin oxidoreductase